MPVKLKMAVENDCAGEEAVCAGQTGRAQTVPTTTLHPLPQRMFWWSVLKRIHTRNRVECHLGWLAETPEEFRIEMALPMSGGNLNGLCSMRQICSFKNSWTSVLMLRSSARPERYATLPIWRRSLGLRARLRCSRHAHGDTKRANAAK